MRTTRARAVLVVPVLGAPLLLTACGAADTTTAAPTPTASATPSPTPTVPAEVQCLESGTWVVDAQREADLFGQSIRTMAAWSEVAFGGETTYTFADGVLTRAFTGWQESFAMTPSVDPSAHFESTTTVTGSATSPYTATETQVEAGAGDASGVTVSVTALDNGQPWSSEDDPQAQRREDLQAATTWLFSCTGDDLRLTTVREGVEPDPTSEFGSVVLHRR